MAQLEQAQQAAMITIWENPDVYSRKLTVSSSDIHGGQVQALS
jgi:hypothetical protein